MSARARLLLVEGVPAMGKSTLLDRLVRRHVAEAGERQVRTLLHLTQAHTYGPLAPAEDAGTLTRGDNLAHLERVIALLEWLAASVAAEATTKCFALVDTLHLTHCLRPGVLAWQDVDAFDRRLAAIGCKLLLLDADEALIHSRTLEARAGTSFLAYAQRRFATAASELAAHFLRERDAFRRLFAGSAMPKLTLPAGVPVDELAARAWDFWTAP
jgi:hypothetical protein